MKVGVLSYPMLFQRRGGLQVQVRATIDALQAQGVDAKYMDVVSERLDDFNIIHVFGAINGNHRIVEAANNAGVPVVLSSVLHPSSQRQQRLRAEWSGRLVGRLTGWEYTTSYDQIVAALHGAKQVVALGEVERQALIQDYGVAEDQVTVIPNGIADRFFTATADEFIDRIKPQRPFALCVASVSEYKNQLGLVRALADTDVHLYLIGDCHSVQRAYLEACLKEGGGKVHYVGSLDHQDPLLSSAYAAADVFALPSTTEVMPISVLEALAADTPTVITRHHSLDLSPAPGQLTEVDPSDPAAIRSAVAQMIAKPAPAHQIRSMVWAMRWNSVARELLDAYVSVQQKIRNL